MSAVQSRKRWWLWLPLLAMAFWLALFGDKTPTGGAVSAPTSTSHAPKQTGERLPLPARTSSAAATYSTIAPTATTPFVLDPLIPRSELILSRKAVARIGGNLFASGSWSPPLPPPLAATVNIAPPAVPPAPAAPKLPFTFVGKKLEAGAWEVFLTRGEQSYVVHEGSVIDNTYRIDNITPPNISLTYLPLGQSQSLSIGASE